MRKCLLFSVVLSVIFLNSFETRATHQLGGELTWECLHSGQNSGKFVFRMTIICACFQGVANCAGGSISIANPLYAKYGGISSFTVVRVSSRELNQSCYSPVRQISCGQSIAKGGDLAAEEHLFVSQPVQLNGVPDTGGTEFFFTTSNRPNLQNAIGPNAAYYLRTVMYPYIDPATSAAKIIGASNSGPSCYDSSPIFAERPWAVICVNQYSSIDHRTLDYDGDVVKYDWAVPLNYITYSLPMVYKPGFSDSLPLPNFNHNINNVGPFLDKNTGLVTFKVYNDSLVGYHVIGVKSTSYRNGQKISETFRDVPIILFDCNKLASSPQVYNVSPPKIEVKETTSSVYQNTFNKTYKVGSVISLDFKVTDFDSLPTSPVTKQSVDFTISGLAMSQSLHSQVDCNEPPCAVLDTINPAWKGTYFLDTTTMTVKFIWNTSCLNIKNLPNNGTGKRSKTFNFIAKSKDNWCPSPLVSSLAFSIDLEDSSAVKWNIDSIDARNGGGFIRWPKYTLPGFVSYEIFNRYYSNDPWVFLTRKTNVNSINYYDAASGTDTSSVQYLIQINQGMSCDYGSDFSSIYLRINETPNKLPSLTWNVPYAIKPIVFGQYFVYRQDTPGTWNKLSTQNYGNESFIDNNPIYNKAIKYKIEAKDNLKLASVSNIVIFSYDSIPFIPGFNELNAQSIKIYPNPVSDFLFVEILASEGPMRMDIVNISGSLIEQITLKNSNNKIQLSSLNKGIYFLRFNDSKGKLTYKKFVKTD